MREGAIVKKTFSFSVLVVNYCEYLIDKRQFIIQKQLLRAGTSIGANVFEAQYAESRVDFIHKMKIASKEASETLYWLRLIKEMPGYDQPEKLLIDLNEIMAILSAIITTAKKNLSAQSDEQN